MSAPPKPGEVLGKPVVVFDEVVGHVSGVFLDATRSHPIGLEVTSPGAPGRFLPWVAATVEGEAVGAASSFLLFDSSEPYVERGAMLCREADVLSRLSEQDVSRDVVLGTGTR